MHHQQQRQTSAAFAEIVDYRGPEIWDCVLAHDYLGHSTITAILAFAQEWHDLGKVSRPLLTVFTIAEPEPRHARAG